MINIEVMLQQPDNLKTKHYGHLSSCIGQIGVFLQDEDVLYIMYNICIIKSHQPHANTIQYTPLQYKLNLRPKKYLFLFCELMTFFRPLVVGVFFMSFIYFRNEAFLV